jgi:hypothetical protein
MTPTAKRHLQCHITYAASDQFAVGACKMHAGTFYCVYSINFHAGREMIPHQTKETTF